MKNPTVPAKITPITAATTASAKVLSTGGRGKLSEAELLDCELADDDAECVVEDEEPPWLPEVMEVTVVVNETLELVKYEDVVLK